MNKLFFSSVVVLFTASSMPLLAFADTDVFPSSNPNAAEWAMINLKPSLVLKANGGAGVIIGLYDGRADCTHPELVGRCTNSLYARARYKLYDKHGTHTAGTLIGKTYGLAPGAAIINYAVFDDKTYVATGTLLADSWRAAAKQGASIASMSFGCTNLALCFSSGELTTIASDALSGTLYVKAAGNDGVSLPSESSSLSGAGAVTAMSRLILVGSINSGGSPSSFSNQPGEGCLLSSSGSGCTAAVQWKYHFIFAPGENIYAAQPNNLYAYFSGTSMATPVVAASAALIEARWPALKSQPATVANILFNSATDLGAPGVDSVYGWGLLNITKAFDNYGNTQVISPANVRMSVNGADLILSPVMNRTGAIFGQVTAYDAYGRDYTLNEVTNFRASRNLYTRAQAVGSPMAQLGDQLQWSTAFFAPRDPKVWASFGPTRTDLNSRAEFDRSLRLGMTVPVGSGAVQFRLTGLGNTRRDLASDTDLRPLSFFASTDLLNQSALMGVSSPLSGPGGKLGQLTVFGALSTPAQIVRGDADLSQPYLWALADPGRLDLRRSPRKQTAIGAGYWLRLDDTTVLGFTASAMTQRNSFYDLTSNLAAFSGPNRIYNVGAVVNHAGAFWDIYGAAELSSIKTQSVQGPIRYSDTALASAEIGARRSNVFVYGPDKRDQLSLNAVMAPQALSGSIDLSYLAPTPDGLDTQIINRSVSLRRVTGHPFRLESHYRLEAINGWSWGVSGGVGLSSGAESSLTMRFNHGF